MRDDDREKAYGRKRWRKVRARKLSLEPYCECDDCLKLPLRDRPKADVVHHIDGLGPSGPRGYDLDNLQSMFKPHHDRITASRPSRKAPEEDHPGLLG